MARPVVPLKRIAILCAFMFLGLLRAERGTAELQGRVGEPSRLLHISNDRQGTWEFTVLGFHRTVNTGIVLFETDRPLLNLPYQLRWSEIDWHALTQEVARRVQTCIEERCGPLRLLEQFDPSGTTEGRPI